MLTEKKIISTLSNFISLLSSYTFFFFMNNDISHDGLSNDSNSSRYRNSVYPVANEILERIKLNLTKFNMSYNIIYQVRVYEYCFE